MHVNVCTYIYIHVYLDGRIESIRPHLILQVRLNESICSLGLDLQHNQDSLTVSHLN